MSEPSKAAADAAFELERAGDRQVEERHADATAIYRVGEQIVLALDRLGVDILWASDCTELTPYRRDK